MKTPKPKRAKPSAKPNQQARTVKARRYYFGSCFDHPAGGTATTLHSVQRSVLPPVAVLDVSDESALIEQAARALHGGSWTYDVGEEFTRESYRDSARAVLESIGIIRPGKRRKEK